MASSSAASSVVAFLALLSLVLTCSASQSASATSLSVHGSVYCDACHVGRVTSSSYFIKGATVAVRCSTKAGVETAYVEGRTGAGGSFAVHVEGEHSGEDCVAALVRSPTPACSGLAAAGGGVVRVGSVGEVHAGPLAFRPAKAASCATSEAAAAASHSLDMKAYATPYPTTPSRPSSPSLRPPASPKPSYGPKPPSSSSSSSSSSSTKPPYAPKCPPPPAYTKPPSSSSSPTTKPPSAQYHHSPPPPPY